MEKKSREKNRERLGLLNEEESAFTYEKRKEMEELKECSFHPNSNTNRTNFNTSRNQSTLLERSESKEALFTRLHDVKIIITFYFILFF